jgi:hypothetical protein
VWWIQQPSKHVDYRTHHLQTLLKEAGEAMTPQEPIDKAIYRTRGETSLRLAHPSIRNLALRYIAANKRGVDMRHAYYLNTNFYYAAHQIASGAITCKGTP